jgi:patatin-like phospholipase/acyl hydrolase
LPWPPGKPYRILSLDGGGIRGAYAATILADIEAEITGGEPIADYFDAIAGTSTGGIIALGLGLKKPAAALKQLYIESGNRVFPEFWSQHPLLKFLRQCFRVLHDQRVLESLLYETFGDATLGQSWTRLVIPAFLGPATQIRSTEDGPSPRFQERLSDGGVGGSPGNVGSSHLLPRPCRR